MCVCVWQTVKLGPDGMTVTGFEPYLDDVPFCFYTVLQDVDSLPETMGDALRQWFETTV